MHIRDAVPSDASAACDVLRRSIAQLCVADHRGDAGILRQWLNNKTPATVASWIAETGNTICVALDGKTLLTVGSVRDSGEITLNYVSPDARFRGVSKAMVAALEDRALTHGNVHCTLTSTETAHHFYRKLGYVDAGAPVSKFGLQGYPMSRRLVDAEPDC
jgi:GNAT superfamily N-acetyltransferase